MSRGRGSARGRGRGVFAFGGSNLPTGVTFADVQALSREEDPLYPPLDPLPFFTDITSEEESIYELQKGFAARLRKSAYYVVEKTVSTDLPRYSDKYRQSFTSQPTLRKKDLHEPFFPPELFDAYFNTKKKRKVNVNPNHSTKVNLDDMVEDAEAHDISGEEESENDSQVAESDYDVEEEYDNDYAENYFDNGEGDDIVEELGGDADDGGGADYD